jgi:hypothetical protein
MPDIEAAITSLSKTQQDELIAKLRPPLISRLLWKAGKWLQALAVTHQLRGRR